MANPIELFYSAFQKRDAEAMIKQYHQDIEFEDPAFGSLTGNNAKNMWRMLINSSKDLEISYSNITLNNEKGRANWEAKYTFSKTGRRIHNKIKAQFVIKDGKIIQHKDNFSFYKWAIQAFGFKGLLLGWSPMFKSKFKKETNKVLKIYERRNRLI